MRIPLFIFIAILLSLAAATQTYVAIAPALTNDAGTLPEKGNLSVEIGRQWDVFSLGLDFGKTSLGKVRGRDTTAYLEIRPNLNVFQHGKFTNTFTAGIGYIFNSREGLMTELTSGIEYAYSPTFHFNVNFGQYYYSGRKDVSTVTFFGISVMMYFKAYKFQGLVSPGSSDQ
jgi:hypothetical protein